MDPLNLTPKMRAAYDFIRKNGRAIPGDIPEPTARALKKRGLVELFETPTGSENLTTWVVMPLGSKRPRSGKVKLPAKARPVTVSAALGRYRDRNGNKLDRAPTRAVEPEDWTRGGYLVNKSDTEGIVLVSYVTPDDMSPLEALDARPARLRLYAEILRKARYRVHEDSDFNVLYVSR